MITGIIFPVFVMGGLGVLFGCLLAYASQKFAVEVDPRVAAIREALPGANCGGCGFPGCDGYAAACVEGSCPLNKCAAGGAPVAEKIAQIMGVAAEAADPQVAFVRCQGTHEMSPKNCVYLGISDCQSAIVVPGGGSTSCTFACLGFGSCVKACAFDAIHIVNGVAKVDREKCVGCGSCMAACPRNVITMVPKKKKVHVACSNTMPGAFVRQVCKTGCIGCQMCVKVCPKKAISMKGALAVIDSSLCIGCGLCAMKCPAHAIDNAGKKPAAPLPKSA